MRQLSGPTATPGSTSWRSGVQVSASRSVKATADFTPTGGPSVASGQLTYTCTSATLGSACSGTQTASTASQTNVVTLGAGACTGGGGSCSSVDPNTVQTSFALVNNPT